MCHDALHAIRGRRILIVDDCDHITSLLKDLFGACGAQVTAVNNGQAAMMALQLHAYDVLMLDLVMPHPDGWDVLSFVRCVCPLMLPRTIVLTGDRYHPRALNNFATGPRVIFKPFDVVELRNAVVELVARTQITAA